MRARSPLLRGMLLALVLAAIAALPQHVQAQGGPENQRATQRKLDRAKQELKDVATERRKVEGQRGAASRRLREVDERVNRSSRALREAEAELQRQQAELEALQARREALGQRLGAQRDELARLLRAVYAVGEDAPLKLMLSQDRVAEGNRLLAYHGYLQRDRARRIAALRIELADLTALERQIAASRAELDAMRERRQAELARLEADRKARERTVAELDQRYQDRRAREQALGRDVKGLEKLLAQLRAAAARAEAERKAAAARAAREGGAVRRPDPVIANAEPIRVGGLGWPLSGTLVTGYGATLPDGRRSEGVLIGAPSGTTVQAVANGKVVFAEWMTGYGLLCIIDHGDGYMSLYAHNDGLLRDAGSDVQRGDPVATVGHSGGQGRPALYFELRRNGKPVDPRSWLQKR